MTRTLRLVLAAAAALTMTAVAAGAQDFQTRHVVVAYGDLDLSSSDGRSELSHRIDSAAAMACGGHPAFNPSYHDAPIYYDKAFVKCLEAARHEAVTLLYRQGVRVASLSY